MTMNNVHEVKVDFEGIFKSSPALLLILLPVPEFTIVAVSDAYVLATDTKREDILGRGIFNVFPENPSDPNATGVKNLTASLQRVISTKAPDVMAVTRYDIPQPHEDGAGFVVKFWTPVNAPVIDDNGEVSFIIHKVEDVTEFIKLKQQGAEQEKINIYLKEKICQKETEIYLRAQQVQEANDKLRQAHGELQTLYNQVKELDQLKSQFFANVSHELRTPLTLILGPIRHMLAQPDLTRGHKQELEVVLRNGQQLLKHVNDLLDVAKLESGRMLAHYTQINLTSLIKLTVSNFESIARDRNMKLTMDFPKTLLISTDQDMVRRMIINLLGNAFKFTPPGGEIRVYARQLDQTAIIGVQDNGPGIPKHMSEAIFERFRQVEGSDSRKHGGTGLGLAIVKEFVEVLKGSIRTEKVEPNGVRFIVELPLQAPPGEKIEMPHKAVAIDEMLNAVLSDLKNGTHSTRRPKKVDSKGSVLIVEDNHDMNHYLEDILSEEYETAVAFNGEEGLKQMQSIHPDLILTDVMMPEMSGFEMIKEIRKNAAFASIPIMILTAKANDGMHAEFLKAGAQDYILKPFSSEELLVRVKNLISMKHVNDSLTKKIHVANSGKTAQQFDVIHLEGMLKEILTRLDQFESHQPPQAN